MNLQEFYERADQMKLLEVRGKDIIAEIENLIKRGFEIESAKLQQKISVRLSDHLNAVKLSEHKLLVSFYGLRLLFCIDLKLTEGQSEGNITAYSLAYKQEQEESFLLRYGFDRDGNMTPENDDGKMHVAGEGAKEFLEDVFSTIAKAGLVSRPL
jgi:hypothetical protein